MLPKSIYFFFINLSTKIIWYIICLFLCWQLKSCSLKQNVHENKVFLFNIFRLAFSLSSLFWYMYIIIISPFHVCAHYYGHVTSYFGELSFDFYRGGGHGKNLKKTFKDPKFCFYKSHDRIVVKKNKIQNCTKR
jgi:hypothetical protein